MSYNRFDAQPAVSETVVSSTVLAPVIEQTIIRPVIVQESLRIDRVQELQPVITRHIDQPIVHTIETHVFQPAAPISETVTLAPIVSEIVHAHIINEVQEVLHKQVSRIEVEKIEEHKTEYVEMPALYAPVEKFSSYLPDASDTVVFITETKALPLGIEHDLEVSPFRRMEEHEKRRRMLDFYGESKLRRSASLVAHEFELGKRSSAGWENMKEVLEYISLLEFVRALEENERARRIEDSAARQQSMENALRVSSLIKDLPFYKMEKGAHFAAHPEQDLGARSAADHALVASESILPHAGTAKLEPELAEMAAEAWQEVTAEHRAAPELVDPKPVEVSNPFELLDVETPNSPAASGAGYYSDPDLGGEIRAKLLGGKTRSKLARQGQSGAAAL